MAQRLGHVYWIGGASGAGKSTIARRLADRYGLGLYDTDAMMGEHARRSPDAAYLAKFMAMDMDERWMNRDPQEMLETFHWYHGEAFEQIAADLAAIEEPVVAEGFRLLPELVRPLAAPEQALWLLPTPQFRRQVFERRGPQWSFLGRVSDPGLALENLLARDGMFTERLRSQTVQLGLKSVEVDGTVSEEALETLVAQAFGLQAR